MPGLICNPCPRLFTDGPIWTRWYDTQAEQAAFIIAGHTSSPQFIDSLTVDNLPEPVSDLCVEQHTASGVCTLSVFEPRRWRFRLAYPQFPEGVPGSRTVFISVSAEQVVPIDSTITAWHACSFDPAFQCREFQSRVVHRGTEVYSKDLTSPLPASLAHTFPDESLYWIAQGESGRDVVLGRGRWDMTHQFSPEMFRAGVPAEQPGFFDFVETVDTCTIEYRRRLSFSTVLGAPVPEPTACARGNLAYAGTIDQMAGPGTIAPRAKNPFARNASELNGRHARTIADPFVKRVP